MKTITILNLLIFLIIYSIELNHGVDFKKRQTRLLSVYCFLTFFLIGVEGAENIFEAIIGSLIFTLVVIFGGIIYKWNQESAVKWLRDQEEKQQESIRKLDMRPSSKKNKKLSK